jgi:putative molybdopterin biosynthesis protein
VAAAVASGAGDAGMGIEAAARAFGLDFVPLLTEDYFLVCMKDALDHPGVTLLREALQGDAWRQAMAALPGYTVHPQSGDVLPLTRALPWWRYRAAKAKPSLTKY